MSGEFVSEAEVPSLREDLPQGEALNFCTEDFGPLEVAYHYETVAKSFTRQAIESRPKTMWQLSPSCFPSMANRPSAGTWAALR